MSGGSRKCKRCGKVEHCKGPEFTSEYCYPCRSYEWNRERRRRYVEEHKCFDCGHEVEPKVVYHLRCTKCRAKNREWARIRRKKPKNEKQ